MASNLIPFNGNVIIRPEAPVKKSTGGVLLPETTSEKPELGEVIAIGQQEEVTGTLVVSRLKVGQKVYYKKWTGQEIKYKGETYIVVDRKDILAIWQS